MSEQSLSLLNFDDVLPLPHRAGVFLQLGICLWYTLVWVMYYGFHINCLALLNFAYSSHKYTGDGQDIQAISGEMATVSPADLNENVILLQGIRRTVTKTFTFTSAGLIFYWTCLLILPATRTLEFASSTLPLILLLTSLFTTFRKGTSLGQHRVNSTLKRILVGRINSATMRTNDILLSDSLTSYSKVINDLVSFLWATFIPASASYNHKVEAFVLSYPALIRVKQCWYEFKITGQRQHMLNLFKYAALLGPVIVNLLIKMSMESFPEGDSSQQLNSLNRWWYILSAISSTYLFIWDIKMDWGFEALDIFFRLNVGNTYILRGPNKLVYKNYFGYYLVILLDFLIRFVWVMKIFVIKETEIEMKLHNHVGNFLFGYDYLSFGFAMLEVLEIVRRWLWCFIKLESDVIKLQLKDDFARGLPLANIKLN